MRLIYMAHEYGGKPENLEAARRWLRLCNDAAAVDGDVVIAHYEELARRCDETWLVGPRISAGMAREMNAAMMAGRLVIAMLTPGLMLPVPGPESIANFVRNARIHATPMLAGRVSSWS